MKGTIAAVLGIALLVDLVAFFGLAFGTGALCVAACPGELPLTQTTFGNAGLSMYVEISNPMQAVVADAYSLGSSAMQSTTFTFDLHLFTNGTCGTSYGWDLGTSGGYSPGYFLIQLATPNGSVPFEISNGTTGGGGSIHPGGTPTNMGWGPVFPYYTVNENSTVASDYCYSNYGAGSAPGPQGHIYFPTSLTFNGKYPDGAVIEVSFVTQIFVCGANTLYGATLAKACDLAPVSPAYSVNSFVGAATGEGRLRSGFSELFPQQGVAYNGGSLLVPYVTGYAGSGGYSAQFIQGPCMANPGQLIQTLPVPGSSAGVLDFSVPPGLSRSVSPSSCPAPYTPNTAQVWLFSAWSAQSVIWRQLVDISPNSAPGVPTLSAIDEQGHTPAVVQDTIQITMSASYTNASGRIQYFQASAYYDAGESTPPVSSTYWVGGTAQGVQIPSSCSGSTSGTCSATWTFTITQAAPIDAIVQDITNSSQGNQATIAIQVQIETCPGDPTCGGGGGHGALSSTLWAQYGPYLLAAAILLGLALLALVAPAIPTAIRVAIVVAPAVLLWILWTFVVAMFQTGGVLA